MAPIPAGVPVSGIVVASCFGAIAVIGLAAPISRSISKRQRYVRKAEARDKRRMEARAACEARARVTRDGSGKSKAKPALSVPSSDGSSAQSSGGSRVIDNYGTTEVVLTTDPNESDNSPIIASRFATETLDESGLPRTGLVVPPGKYIDTIVINGGCPATPTIYAIDGGRSCSTLHLDAHDSGRDISEADAADRGAISEAAGRASFAPGASQSV